MSADLQVKGISKELKTRLSVSTGRNFRSINQEALAGEFRPGSLDRLGDLAAKAKAKARG